MIPTAILAGFALGFWMRWWAIPTVAAGWAVVILFIDPSSAVAGAFLGALNASIGVLLAVGLRRLVATTRAAHAHHPN